MARNAQVSMITEASTYDDIAEAAEEADANHGEEPEIAEIKNEIEPALEIIPEVIPKAKRKSRAKPVEQLETEAEPEPERETPTAPEPQPEPEELREAPAAPKPKARAKRASKVKVEELPVVLEATRSATGNPPPEKPKAVRKPRIVKEVSLIQPTIPVRMSRMAAREKLYQNLASNALP